MTSRAKSPKTVARARARSPDATARASVARQPEVLGQGRRRPAPAAVRRAGPVARVSAARRWSNVRPCSPSGRSALRRLKRRSMACSHRVLTAQGDAAAPSAPARSTQPLPDRPSARWPWHRLDESTARAFSPCLTPEGVVREAFSLFIHALGRKPFDGLDNPGVEARADAPGEGCHRPPPA